MNNSISNRIQIVQDTFMGIQRELLNAGGSLEALVQRLEKEPPLFRSVSFESASMGIAWQGIVEGDHFQRWKAFAKAGMRKHLFHVQIGLGWALGKAGCSPSDHGWPEFPVIRPLLLDGFGYYFALYRGRRTLKQAWVPVSFSSEDQYGFDSGVGRRIWHASKGDLATFEKMIGVFPPDRIAGLWHGVGLASGYVGGTDFLIREGLLSLAGPHHADLKQGMKLAGISRLLSGTFDEGVSSACLHLSNLSKEGLQSAERELSQNWDLYRSIDFSMESHLP